MRIARHVLEEGGTRVAVLSLGCITQSWEVEQGGAAVPVVLGYSRAEDYLDNPFYLGVIAGRVAGRISGAAFDWDGARWQLEANEGAHHLHGGTGGLHRRNWDMEPEGARGVQLRLTSEHGDEGYPGRLELTVTIRLENGWLTYAMLAEADRPAPVNLAQHSYYNLMGGGPVHGHRVTVPAARFLPAGAGLIPDGTSRPLEGRPFDLRRPRSLAQADPAQEGLDMTLAGLDAGPGTPIHLTAPNGMHMTLVSDQPCLQLYTGAHLAARHGAGHAPFHGLCLEPQGYPDAVNCAGFPVSMAAPERPYRQHLAIRIATGEGT